MMTDSETGIQEQFEALAASVCERLAENSRVRRNLPGHGRLRMDRQLPFLCVYRAPPGRTDRGTRDLVTTEAAYLFSSGEAVYHDGLAHLCEAINEAMQEHFGVFLFLEVWAAPLDGEDSDPESFRRPAFEIVAPDSDSLPTTIDSFHDALSQIRINGQDAVVTSRDTGEVVPPDLQPLTSACAESGPSGCCVLGLAVRPIYRDPHSGELYPLVLRALRSQLATALRAAISQFTGVSDGAGNAHYESLGPTSLVKAVRQIDRELCEVSGAYDFLLQVTPTNSDEAWEQFQSNNFRKQPDFQYRPLPFQPSTMKRRLFSIEIERIEDPTLGHLCWEKQEEIDRQLTALRELNTSNFPHATCQLYGEPDRSLVELAETILRFRGDSQQTTSGETAPIEEVVEEARREIDGYHRQLEEFRATVEVCDHIASGIMVSRNRLLIARNATISRDRVVPLLHHEIGTHLLTYFNGWCQPFRQLCAGLAGFEGLQEGLAIFAEYLTGGLTAKRMRSLAARVVAVDRMLDGTDFSETFHHLHSDHDISARAAFRTTLRAYRGGGLTKDIIYLRGLRDLLAHLNQDHDLEPLYVGKIGLHHLPFIQEMRRRGIVDAPRLLPRFWNDDDHQDRLAACHGLTVLDLMEMAQ